MRLEPGVRATGFGSATRPARLPLPLRAAPILTLTLFLHAAQAELDGVPCRRPPEEEEMRHAAQPPPSDR